MQVRVCVCVCVCVCACVRACVSVCMRMVGTREVMVQAILDHACAAHKYLQQVLKVPSNSMRIPITSSLYTALESRFFGCIYPIITIIM